MAERQPSKLHVAGSNPVSRSISPCRAPASAVRSRLGHGDDPLQLGDQGAGRQRPAQERREPFDRPRHAARDEPRPRQARQQALEQAQKAAQVTEALKAADVAAGAAQKVGLVNRGA